MGLSHRATLLGFRRKSEGKEALGDDFLQIFERPSFSFPFVCAHVRGCGARPACLRAAICRGRKWRLVVFRYLYYYVVVVSVYMGALPEPGAHGAPGGQKKKEEVKRKVFNSSQLL